MRENLEKREEVENVKKGMKKGFRRIMAVLLTMTMLVQLSLPATAAATVDENGMITMYDEKGNAVESHSEEEWAELYPYGIFAFKESQLILTEGKAEGTKEGKLTLYRIGGTEGRAEATVTLYPAVTQLEENTWSYANAAGVKDYSVMVEDPWNIAKYQPIGGAKESIYAGGVLKEELQYADETVDGDADDTLAGVTGITLGAPIEDADSYQWQMEQRFWDTSYALSWKDIDGATAAEMVVSENILNMMLGGTYTYDFRCIYVKDGVTYCSETWMGVAYDQNEDVPPVKPADFVEDHTRTDSTIIFDGEEYDNYYFDVVFAEDEWTKEITFTVKDDTLHEAEEAVGVVITDSRGAEINKSACTASVVITDDEEQIPSAIGFSETEIWADKSEGKVRIPLMREGNGMQYIVAADYEIEEGTAAAGVDYAAENGTALFASDMDYTYIEIELVDDHIQLKKEDSELYFTVKLTEAKGAESTLIPDSTELKVYLYNSTEGEASNLATNLYSPDEKDMTGSVKDTTSIVPAGGNISASTADAGENVVAQYSLVDEGFSWFTYTYPGQLSFDNAHGGSYWTDNAALASETSWDGAVYPKESDDHEKYVADAVAKWSGEYGRYGSTGMTLKNEKGGSMEMSIPNLAQRYSFVQINVRTRSDSSAGGWYGGDDWSLPEFAANQQVGGSGEYDYLNDYPGDNRTQYKSLKVTLTDRVVNGKAWDKLSFWHHYTGGWPEGDAQCETNLINGYLARRTIPLPILRIHTADDDYLQEKAASLHESIKPVVSLVAGKGGTDAAGSKLYNNSQVQVTRGNNASAYTFATTANGQLGNSLFFSGEEEAEKHNLTTTSIQNEVGTMTLLVDEGFNEQGYINVVMDRSQKISLEISPSVPKMEGFQDINSAEIPATWDDLWSKIQANGYQGITYKYREANWNFNNGNDGFTAEKTGTLTKEMIRANDSLYTAVSALKNVRSINFHLNADDIIVVNGLSYAGNADIPIPANQYLNDNITFYYYDADYVTGINTMVATISRVERYIDLNDDGVVEGSINPLTGEFVPGEDEHAYVEGEDWEDYNRHATYYVLPSVTEDFYSISQMAPRADEDGTLHQILLKVYYTMLPRSLVVPEGESEADTAEVIPAIVTAVTDSAARNSMTEEQLGYRYINHGGSGNGKLMYTEKASTISFVDLPLGGDVGTYEAYRDDDGKEVVSWEPVWIGNPYDSSMFTEAAPIYLDGTLVGDRYPVGETDETGALTDEGIETVRNYLSAMQENDTFTLCVRETPEPESAKYTVFAGEPAQYLKGIESSRLSDTRTYPASTAARNLGDPLGEDEHETSFDSSDSPNPMQEYNMAGQLNLPQMELGVSDFVSFAIDGQEMAISVGANLLGMSMESDWADQENMAWGDAEKNAGPAANQDSIDKLKQAWNSLTGRDGEGKDTIRKEFEKGLDDWDSGALAKDNLNSEKNHAGIRNKEFGVSLAVNLTFLLKWDPIESQFMFNQMMIAIAGGLELSYTMHLTPCPIFYCCFTVGISAELSFGLEASRIKVIGQTVNFDSENAAKGWTYYDNQQHMGYDDLDAPEEDDFIVGEVGSSMTYTTDEKALDVHFTGSLYVEAVGAQPEGFEPGRIYSAGDEAVTIKLAKKVDGKKNDQNYTLKFTVINDEKEHYRYYEDGNGTLQRLPEDATVLDKIVTIRRQTHDVYFSGVNVSPELFFEAAVGISLVVFKAELYLNVSVGCSMGFAVHDTADYYGEESETSAFELNEFSFAAGLGFRLEALFFSYDFSAIQFVITYDRETKYDEDTNKKNGWNFMWYAANQPIESYDALGETEEPLTVQVILPGMKTRNEELYSPEENRSDVSLFAFNPSDKSVPFQYSGYGSTGDAFALGTDLALGSTYEIITANGKNYIVYSVTRNGAEGDIHDTQLVLSEVKETVPVDEETGEASEELGTYGLAHPFGETGNYLVLDEDEYGDLDFDAWVDDDGQIHAAWVSYTDKATEAYNEACNVEGGMTNIAIGAMKAAGQCTEVKTVTVDVTEKNKGTVEVVSGNEEGHGMYYLPSGAGDMVFYAEACYYEEEELTELLNAYKEFYGKTDYTLDNGNQMYYGEDDPSSGYQMTVKGMRAEVYGKSFYPTFAIKTKDGYEISKVTAKDWIDNQVQLENADITCIDGNYYASYSTAQASLMENKQDEENIKKLYLQKLTVDEADGKAVPGKAVALRKLVDRLHNNSADGVYVKGALSTAYEDPYFANVRFLQGKLGSLDAELEQFDEQIEMQSYALNNDSQKFMIFEMNGNTYVIPEESLLSITDENSGSGKVIPFFARETAEQMEAKDDPYAANTPAVTNVTIGADGNGNITAVYTRGETGIPGNAVYMTKYDPLSTTWGVGTRLAMRDMDIAEEGETNKWDADEISLKYHDTNENEKLDADDAPKSFTFNRLRVGLAGEDKLLVVTEGTLMNLEAVPKMAASYDSNGNLTGIKQEKDEDDNLLYTFNAKSGNEGYESTNGIYAISFGMGNQKLGAASLNLSNYDLTNGSEMTASVSFVNNGDVAIRASEKNPAKVSLMIGDEQFAEWDITENVRAGQKVKTESAYMKLHDINIGDKIYFTVQEDPTYISDGNAFSVTTKTEDGEADTAACITITEQVEMGYEEFDINMVSADDDSVTLAPNIHVGNRGGKTSDITYLHFQYEKVDKDGVTNIYPVDLTGHKLNVSEESAISRFGDERTLQNGYLMLCTTQDGVVVEDDGLGQIQSMYGRTVTGTFTIPKDYYDTEYGTGSLNLRVTVESFDSSDEVNAEYNEENNMKFFSVEPQTLFNTVNSIDMQVGAVLRLPVTMQTNKETAPTVTVTELTDDGNGNLSVLYYDSNQKAIVVMAAKEGEGKIRIADTATNSFHDICYIIKGSGVELNIYDDNGIFAWYDAAGNGGETGHDAWDFNTALNWAEDLNAAPLRGDLSIGYEGQSFSFQSFATTLKLYFMGADTNTPAEIEVSSNLSGFGTKTYTSDNGLNAVEIDFDNEDSVAHNITIKVKSNEARFDCLEEIFEEDRIIKTDPTAPGIYWSRTLPKAASIEKTQTVELTAYFMDLGGLASVTMDEKDVTDLIQKDGEELWALPLTFESNGSHRFVVIDKSGNTTTRDLSIDWFSATTPVHPDKGAPDITTALVQKDGSAIPTLIPGDMEVFYQVKDAEGNAADAVILKYAYDNEEAPTRQSFVLTGLEDTGMGYPVMSGIYRASVTNEDGVSSFRFVNLDERDSNYPIAALKLSADGTKLLYSAEKEALDNGALNKIVSVMLNGIELLPAGVQTYRYNGEVPVNYGGTYQLIVTDEIGNRGISEEVKVDSLAVALEENAVTVQKVTETATTDENGNVSYTSNKDGKVIVDTTKLSGGLYDSETSEAAGEFLPKYEYAVIPVSGNNLPTTDENTVWGNDSEITGLDAGAYVLYIRDANDPDNMTGPFEIQIGFLRVVIQNVKTSPSYRNVANGEISFTAEGGSGTYEYAYCAAENWSEGTVVSWGSVSHFKEVPIGTYYIMARDKENPDNIAIEEVTVEAHVCETGTLTKGIAATCLEDGRKDYYTCVCGDRYFDEACKMPVENDEALIIEALGHTDENQDEWCDACGTDLHVCKQGTLQEGTPATCLEDGTKDYYTCSRGHRYFDETCTMPVERDEDLIIKAFGHADEDTDGLCDGCGIDLTPEEPEIPEKPEAPATGDSFNMVWWSMMLLLAIGVVVYFRKRKIK